MCYYYSNKKCTLLKGTMCFLISDVLLLCSASGSEPSNRGICLAGSYQRYQPAGPNQRYQPANETMFFSQNKSVSTRNNLANKVDHHQLTPYDPSTPLRVSQSHVLVIYI